VRRRPKVINFFTFQHDMAMLIEAGFFSQDRFEKALFKHLNLTLFSIPLSTVLRFALET